MDLFASIDLWLIVTSFGAIFLGLFVGMLFGALPGLGLIVGITLLLPLSYSMGPTESILMLLACYQGAEYGGSISAIVIGIPGTAMAVPILLDGHEMAKKTSPGKALAYSLYGSTFGGVFGGVILILFAQPLAIFALKLGDTEFFLLGMVGLLAVASFGAVDFLKALISVGFGLIAGIVGLDMFTGEPRLTFDALSLYDGVNLISVAVGLFAFSEVLIMLSGPMSAVYSFKREDMKIWLTARECVQGLRSMFMGSSIGAIIGILPGVGGLIAGWLAYSGAKAVSKTPEKFGKGSGEGIASPDAANNATVGGALLPFIALGIPGSASIAIIAGAFIIHGIQPGPSIMRNNPDLIQAIFIGFMATTVCMFIMGKMLTPLFARALNTPNAFLIPVILISSIIGIYSSTGNFFDIWLAFGLGLAAYILRRLDFSIAAFIMAMVLSPIIERSFRRSLVISDGDYSVFFTRFYSQVLWAAIALTLIYTFYAYLRKRRALQIVSE